MKVKGFNIQLNGYDLRITLHNKEGIVRAALTSAPAICVVFDFPYSDLDLSLCCVYVGSAAPVPSGVLQGRRPRGLLLEMKRRAVREGAQAR
ncbi:unnamed protein product, partial [Brenthis ino]